MGWDGIGWGGVWWVECEVVRLIGMEWDGIGWGGVGCSGRGSVHQSLCFWIVYVSCSKPC